VQGVKLEVVERFCGCVSLPVQGAAAKEQDHILAPLDKRKAVEKIKQRLQLKVTDVPATTAIGVRAR